MPRPDHISARPEDLPSLIEGIAAFDRRSAKELDGVVAAALAFGFVYVHPFSQDGNGRIHRYLIHHVLAQRGYNPAGVVFPARLKDAERESRNAEILQLFTEALPPPK